MIKARGLQRLANTPESRIIITYLIGFCRTFSGIKVYKFPCISPVIEVLLAQVHLLILCQSAFKLAINLLDLALSGLTATGGIKIVVG